MVYHGRSRACATCKKRRKKCDQVRPACLRCINSNRTCTGYEEDAVLAFTQYETHLSIFKTRARKCSLPRRTFIPGTDILVADVNTKTTEVSEEQKLDYALRAFIYDFCIVRSDSGASRGFLSSLERTVIDLGSTSILVKSCQAVSYLTHGQALQRPDLVYNAEMIYHEVLGSLAGAIEHSTSKVTKESTFVAMILGIYEMSRPNSTTNRDHCIHARGLGAFLGTGHSPLDLLNGLTSSNLSEKDEDHRSGKAYPLFAMPRSNDQTRSLDNLLLELDRLWTRYTILTQPKDYGVLKADCTALLHHFITWDNNQAPEARPIAVANLGPLRESTNISVGCWPGRVDTYSDIYIASVWNIARGAQILLLVLIERISADLNDTNSSPDHMPVAETTIEAMIASIPYHLTENLYSFVDGPTTDITEPGRTLGGLLLMYPLYIASRVPRIPEPVADYLRRCLIWIASNMGIGQADLLAKSPDIDEGSLLSGCMIIWAGFLT